MLYFVAFKSIAKLLIFLNNKLLLTLFVRDYNVLCTPKIITLSIVYYDCSSSTILLLYTLLF